MSSGVLSLLITGIVFHMKRAGASTLHAFATIAHVLLLTVYCTSAGSALAGCAEMPSHAATQVGTAVTAEDHLAASLMYQKQAQQLDLEALRFEEEHARITTFEDPKGFRRSALKTAAQRCRKEAMELNDLAAQHRQKAEEREKKVGG